MQWRLGTTGYHNPGWAGTFYPEGLAQARWLPYYATRFDAIELNTTFHAMPTREKVLRWRDRVGDGFRFALKAFRGITHDTPLASSAPLLEEFVAAVGVLGESLVPILLQLPPDVTFRQFDGLAALLGRLPDATRVAIEFRSPDWFVGETFDLLRERNVGLVAADLEGHPESRAVVPTADFLYVRLLGRHSRFPDETRERFDPTPRLIEWHDRIAAAVADGAVRETWVLFNNDFAGHAPATARRFATLAGLPGPGGPAKQRKLFEP